MEDMEQFVLLLSQSSVHFALQFFWMIYAALDENRPKRAGNNPHTFARCARLLLALEQCFVYGSPAARQASELLTRQSISRDEMEQILMADRRFFAAQQSSTDSTHGVEDVAPISGGWLLKKGGGTRTMGRRNWTMRWCRIEKRILLVFTKPTDSQPRAAIPLHGAKVHVVENKRPFYFEIAHDFSETKAKFAAKTADELSTWVAYIQKSAALPEPPTGSPNKGSYSPERTLARMSFAMRTFIMQSSSNVTSNAIDSATVPSQSGSPSKADSTSRPAEITADVLAANMRTRMLSSGVSQAGDTEVSQYSTTDCCGSDALMQALMLPDQQRRYEFFCNMVHFVKTITDISEALRRVEPPKRKELLGPLLKQLRIPHRAYIPLCKSTDPYCNVVSVFSDEGRVFSTHERAPCLIYFATEENESGEDVSTVLFNDLYETKAPSVCNNIDEDDEIATAFDQHAADIALRQARTSQVSRAKDMPRHMSSFLRELLSDDERKLRIEKTFGELTFTKAERLQKTIQCANVERWRLAGLMSKSFDDLRQEVLVMQLISYFQQIFELEKLPLRLHPYRILSTGSSTGLIEVVSNAMSLDGVKKTPGFKNLRSHFEQMYGEATNNSEGDENGEGAELLHQAKLNFIHSLAAYSIVCYILAIKDRHNGNIMLDIEGYIIHIDFGFCKLFFLFNGDKKFLSHFSFVDVVLGRAPGGSFSFETAPFKLTAEMVDVLGGRHSSNFQYFTDLCVQGALAARKHAETIYTLVEVMSYHSKLPCFVGGAAGPLSGLKDRLFLNISEKKVAPTIQSMVQRAYDHFGTNKYDQFQTFSNGIAK
ncbi:hypothetical protein L914_11633, partial [Phytophthora nicotianae]